MKKSHVLSIAGLSLTSIGALTLPLTSCATVYVDVLKDPFTPDFKQYTEKTYSPTGEETKLPEATEDYFEHVKDSSNPDDFLRQEMLWSASYTAKYTGRRTLEGETGDFCYKSFQIYYSDVKYEGTKIDSETNEILYLVSYKLQGQVESLLDNITIGEGESTASFRKDWYSFELVMKKIPFDFTLVDYTSTKKYWEMTPVRLDVTFYEYPRFHWDPFKDDEYISFNCRHACEGYNKNGKQNYSYEGEEAAIIDKDHNYSPKFEVEMASFFFYDSYYFYQALPQPNN